MNVAAFFVSCNIAGILNLCTVLGGRRRNLSFSYTLGVYHYHTGSINNGIGCMLEQRNYTSFLLGASALLSRLQSTSFFASSFSDFCLLTLAIRITVLLKKREL